MRLMEVGTKAQGQGKKQEAEDMFKKAYELYSLFWGINLKLVDLGEVKKIDENQIDRKDDKKGIIGSFLIKDAEYLSSDSGEIVTMTLTYPDAYGVVANMVNVDTVAVANTYLKSNSIIPKQNKTNLKQTIQSNPQKQITRG